MLGSNHQVSWYLLLADQLYVGSLALVLDAACLRAVLERVQGLFVELAFGRDAGDHDCLGVAAKRVFEDPREFGISEGYKCWFLLF